MTIKVTPQELRDLAEKTGKHQEHMRSIFNGRARPGIQLAISIQEASGGKIKAVDLRPDLKECLQKIMGF